MGLDNHPRKPENSLTHFAQKSEGWKLTTADTSKDDFFKNNGFTVPSFKTIESFPSLKEADNL